MRLRWITALSMCVVAACSIEASGLGTSTPSDGGVRGPDALAALARDAPASGDEDGGARLSEGGPRGDAGSDDAAAEDVGPSCIPAAEICNALDDDCDSVIDEEPACSPCTRADREGNVYLFCATGSTWDEARAACRSRGYDLAIVEDAADQAWLWSVAGPLSSDEYFIGLTDTAAEGVFVWVDDRIARSGGTDLLYTAWKSNAPDNCCGGEHCVELDRGAGGLWEDVLCDQRQSYICETPAR